VERDPLVQHVVVGELVELADELAGLEVEDRVPLLELIELLEHRDRDRDVVLLEVLESVEVVEDDGGVEDEDLLVRLGHEGLRVLSSAKDRLAQAGDEGKAGALITPTLFSRPPDPLPHREKRETVGVGRAARAFNWSSFSIVARGATPPPPH